MSVPSSTLLHVLKKHAPKGIVCDTRLETIIEIKIEINLLIRLAIKTGDFAVINIEL